MSEVSLGTIYDINKNIMNNMDKLSNPALVNKLKKVAQYFSENKTYFMLLCHEKRDYTLFRLTKEDSHLEAADILKECLQNRGVVLEIEKTEDGFAFEIWLKIDGEAFCYYLFPYDEAVIEC